MRSQGKVLRTVFEQGCLRVFVRLSGFHRGTSVFKPCPAAAAWGDGGRSNEFVNSCLPALKF